MAVEKHALPKLPYALNVSESLIHPRLLVATVKQSHGCLWQHSANEAPFGPG